MADVTQAAPLVTLVYVYRMSSDARSEADTR